MIVYKLIPILFASVVLASDESSIASNESLIASENAPQKIKGLFAGAAEYFGKPADPEDIILLLKTAKKKDLFGNVVSFDLKQLADTKSKIFFLVHGWKSDRSNCPFYKPLTKQFLSKYPESHVVQVDWGGYANKHYPKAVFFTESVGEKLAEVTHKLVSEHNVPPENIVFIGHSLGAQISGWVGKKYKNLSQQTLSRIIALDPAGPLFTARPNTRRLDKEDAKVVMVVHSDRKIFGFPQSCGTIEFFLNGGVKQPGCPKLSLTNLASSVSSFSFSTESPIGCNHYRAYQVFVQAIKYPEFFKGVKCNDMVCKSSKGFNKKVEVSMGDLGTSSTGSFYLETTERSPYAKHDYDFNDVVEEAEGLFQRPMNFILNKIFKLTDAIGSLKPVEEVKKAVKSLGSLKPIQDIKNAVKSIVSSKPVEDVKNEENSIGSLKPVEDVKNPVESVVSPT